MTEKMKQMADRINLLEQYKSLCELRIRDFDGNHPLPLSQAHIGQKPVAHQHAEAMQMKLNEMSN
jgi:hypothetical protein